MNSTKAELEALLNRLADGIASEADEQGLGELLRSGPEARKAYREFMALHSALHWDYVAAASPEPPSPKSAGMFSTMAARAGLLVAFVVGTVVAAIVAIAVTSSDAPKSVAKPAVPAIDEAPQGDSIVALLVNGFGAQFVGGRGPDGVRFDPGEYELLEGIVHLRFAQGAEMVLASPARIEVIDAQQVRLAYGEIRVTAPPGAQGFTVSTRTAEYVDLGTEFGLRVDPHSGASDLYVFDGQVNVADPRSGKILSEVVEGGSSRYVDGVSGAAPELKEDDFPAPGSIGLQRWQQYDEEIRKSPGLLAFFPFRRTLDESVLVNGLGEDSMADGRISGARWATGRWPGKDALLFDRNTDFVEIEIPGEHQELTIAAWLKVDRFDFVFNAILNSDGYDLGDIHFQLTRQGYPRGGVVVDGKFEDEVAGNPVPLSRWAHVASVLSTRTRSQQIYVNGVLARERRWESDEVLRPGSCRLGNWLPVTNVGPENRAFRGRIDELAIWNRALPQAEVGELVETGRPGLIWNHHINASDME
jgi:ferric-dicitrate binding protein FerR (iron transport regulator)